MPTEISSQQPETLPISVLQYRTLVDHGTFEGQSGQIELIRGRLVHLNPQGPVHSDPIDELAAWSYEVAAEDFRIRIEKPLEFPRLSSSPEPDVAWVTKGRYASAHPTSEDVHLLIEVSTTSKSFDLSERLRLYAEAGIPEYWVVDTNGRTVTGMREPGPDSHRVTNDHAANDTIAPLCLPSAKLCISRLFA
ncbi:MAG: Uma2 family endonuclease [Planctomycetota bacterium]